MKENGWIDQFEEEDLHLPREVQDQGYLSSSNWIFPTANTKMIKATSGTCSEEK